MQGPLAKARRRVSPPPAVGGCSAAPTWTLRPRAASPFARSRVSSNPSETIPAALMIQRIPTARDGAGRPQVLDARDLAAGPAATVPLPAADLPYGLHSDFVPWDDLEL